MERRSKGGRKEDCKSSYSGTSGDLEEIHRYISTPGRVVDWSKLSSQVCCRPVDTKFTNRPL